MIANGLYVYDITLDQMYGDEMTCISIVDDPAVESDFMLFKKDEQPLMFQADDMERIIFGVAIRADFLVYRNDGGHEYYVRFTRKAIKDIVNQYARDGFYNKVSLQHDGELIDGVSMVSMFIKDVAKGINPKGFENIEDGSLFVAYHVDDENLWDEIKNGNMLNGFSIEIYSTLKPVETVFANEETVDSLVELALADKKKDNYAKSAVTKAMEENKVVDLTVDNNKRITNCQIYQIGRQHGKNVAIFYGDNQYGGKQWYVYETKNITNVQVTTTPFIDWSIARKGASWDNVESLLDTEDITSIKSAVVPANSYVRAINEKKICIITYRDPSQKDCTGSRQCAVLEYGYTRNGNAALRAYEDFGATHHPDDMPGWRTFLLSRILSFQILDYVEPLQFAPAGYNPAKLERDGFHSVLWADFGSNPEVWSEI